MLIPSAHVEAFQLRTGEVAPYPTTHRGWAISKLGSGFDRERYLDPQIELDYPNPAGPIKPFDACFYLSGIDEPEVQYLRDREGRGNPVAYVEEFAISLRALAGLRIGSSDKVKITKPESPKRENWAAISVNEHSRAAHYEGGPIGLNFGDNNSFIAQRFVADRALVAVGVVMVPADGLLFVEHNPEEGAPRETFGYVYRPNSAEGLELTEDRPWGRPSSGGDSSDDREPRDQGPYGTGGGAAVAPDREVITEAFSPRYT